MVWYVTYHIIWFICVLGFAESKIRRSKKEKKLFLLLKIGRFHRISLKNEFHRKSDFHLISSWLQFDQKRTRIYYGLSISIFQGYRWNSELRFKPIWLSYSEMILNGFFLSRLINLIKRCCFLNQFTKVTLRTFKLFFGEIYSDGCVKSFLRIYLSEKQN